MPKSLVRATLVAVALAATAATYAYAAAPATIAKTSKGDALVNGKGMTLYTFAKDTDGKSACNGKCASNWHPFTAVGGGASDGYSVITRDDGAKQWAYKGKPLYTWVKDTKPGDATGDGFLKGAWRIAKP
jgi:predicted lipoprotein with Yx(FWY)xxD motif